MTIETSPGGTEYLVFTPTGYDAGDASTTYPLIVYLHGAQAIGHQINCSFGKGLPGAINNNSNTFFDTLKMFVVAPHVRLGSKCSDLANNDYEWDPAMVNEVVDHFIGEYNIDTGRIFGSGISLGAKGIWDYALAYPDKLIGLAPFSGNAPIENICTLDGVAVWAFHGEADGTIPPTGGADRKGGQTVVETINNCPNAPYLPAYITLFDAKGHNGWDQVYDLSAGYNLYEWLLSLKKDISSNYRPLVNIGPDITIVDPGHSIKINSFAYDPNGSINLYNWEQLAGPSVSFQDGSDHLILNLSPSGSVYKFMLKVTDNEGLTNSDTVGVTVNSSTTGPAVTELRLYDGKNNKDLGPISNNQTISLSGHDPSLLNIIATVENLNTRASVRFGLNENRNFISLNDNNINSNYSIGNNNHKSFVPSEGEYTIKATAYGDRNTLAPGSSYMVTFTFTEEPLPIKLLGFEAKATEEGVELRWTTTEEVNNSHFEIYQGIGNARELREVASIPKANLQKNVNHYSHIINGAPCGTLYYQLKSFDYDGHVDQSEVISITRTEGNCTAKVYPNPVIKNEFKFETMDSGKIHLRLINTFGQTIIERIISEHDNGRANINTSGLRQGVYFLQITRNSSTETKKILVQGN
ncbi:hypothetical protein C900_02614 [Fulvivirga imtechensis AK7]|uniref:Secretion system C-terminal sorting domain-containing protein n=1 Tax=Fulvivirga imtechensis AK7 TaxID=1237149 RepID=L8K0S9_9BACT|nr:T9SS type A sorting domain-containing protein [Fulvivirga imtechensis]ELR73529.1 hypothetical protein C900_02614 [Fulvivirga imtechensis AK7]